MYRIGVDTNVVVSASIGEGNPHRFLLEAIRDVRCTLVTSDDIISEIREVLGRPKFRLSEDETSRALSALESASEIVETTSKFRVAEDSDDDIFINAAYDGGADYIVSGDGDLLDLEEFEGIKIVRVVEMRRILRSDD